MSTRQIGNRIENLFMAEAEALGYATFAARGSRGPIDCICFVNEGEDGCRCEFRGSDHMCERYLRPLAVQVGTAGKAIRGTLEALESAPRPIGSRVMVARLHRLGRGRKSHWTFHTVFGKYETLADAIKA